MKQYKITPLNVKDKAPVYATFWQYTIALYLTYRHTKIDSETDEHDALIILSDDIPVMKVEEMEEIPTGAQPA
jgi:hypothetical protein